MSSQPEGWVAVRYLAFARQHLIPLSIYHFRTDIFFRPAKLGPGEYYTFVPPDAEGQLAYGTILLIHQLEFLKKNEPSLLQVYEKLTPKQLEDTWRSYCSGYLPPDDPKVHPVLRPHP